MKLVYSWFVLLLAVQVARGAVVRRPPAFSKPMYSDSYLPAAMQVIFHAVEQLKIVEQEEESSQNTTSVNPETESMAPPLSTTQGVQAEVKETTPTTPSETVTNPADQDQKKEEGNNTKEEEVKLQSNNSTEADQTSLDAGVEPLQSPDTITTVCVLTTERAFTDYGELPEMNEETPETNYATPETNYEIPEDTYGTEETNQEVSEEDQEQTSSLEPPLLDEVDLVFSSSSIDLTSAQPELANRTDSPKKKEPTIDSIVEEIYEIVKPTPSDLLDEGTDPSGESKSSFGVSIEKIESIEEEEEETRFTLLGEKVAQVPRPSLSSYLRRAKVPPSASLQQLGSLYDALSKDARKQGFGKYTGYSDDVLRTLESSAEGGIASQLQRILGKVIERNELTREDAKTKTSEALKDLDNPSSNLNKDLRTLLPLRFSR